MPQPRPVTMMSVFPNGRNDWGLKVMIVSTRM
jgi:hypothetical protein